MVSRGVLFFLAWFAVQTGGLVVQTPSSTPRIQLMAKKAKGAAGAALEALQALEALEEKDPVVIEPVRKKGKKGAAAAAAAALEGLEDNDPPPAPKKGKKGKKGAAAAAAAALEEIEDLEEILPEAPLGKKGKKGAAAAAAAVLEQIDEIEEPNIVLEDKADEKADEDPAAAAKKAKVLAELEGFDDEDFMPKKKKKKGGAKKKSKKKGKAVVEEEEVVAEQSELMDAVPTAKSLEEDESLTLEEKKKRERGNAKVRVIERGSERAAAMRLEQVSVVFKNSEVLTDATWGVRTGDRLGLVGNNGGGKTTQLRILAGELEPTTGEVVTSSESLKVAFLRQEFAESLTMSNTLIEELSSVFEKEARILQEISDLENDLDKATDDEARLSILDKLGLKQEEATKRGAYAIQGRVEKVAIQMGFGDADLDALVASFSGGWKMRIGLSKVLLTEPDVLLLDEPTNHLDLESVEWLETFLNSQTLAMVIVSHDREFLDQVCNKIVDTEDGLTQSYDDCDYSTFLKRKKQRRDSWEASYKKQQAKINEDKAFINRFRTGSRAQQAKSRERQLDKLLKSSDLVQRPPTRKKGLRIRFPDPPRIGAGGVVACNDVAHGYGDRTLFSNINVELKKGDRVAILGPNGAGKSTLLRLLAGIEQPNQGSVDYGSTNVQHAYFAQNQADSLDLTKTVLQTINLAPAAAKYSYEDLRALLGQFNFKGDTVEKKVESLSGGEKGRLALCTMMLQPHNVLFLDEVTNHLDIGAKETLEEALRFFDGTLVAVSHDRFFVSQVANTIWTLEDGELTRFDGDYASYIQAREDLRAKVEQRYVDRTIQNAQFVDLNEVNNDKKKFGGGAPGLSGRKDKGVKNAKRMK